ncbi:MAG: TAXI family TRAP transporter solute-binding subunit [Rhodospirillaceae bacterium]
MAEGGRESLIARLRRSTLVAKIWVFGPALAIVIAGFAIAGKFVQPAPPDHLTVATGGTTGAYYAFAHRYRDVLAREGVDLRIVATSGSLENLSLLREGKVDTAFLQSGVALPLPDDPILSLGSLYFEPLWLFHRTQTSLDLLSDLAGKRIAVGGIGSGTRAIAEPLLERNGVTRSTAQIVDAGGDDAADALRRGEIDAAFYVASAEAPLIRGLLEDPGIELLSFRRAEAYTRHYLHLSKIVLPRGMVDFRTDTPARDKTLLAPAATMVIHDDLHPALRTLLLRAMTEIHGPGGLFERPGDFPSIRHVDFPVSDKARRYIENGPSLLDRYLPYWVSDMIVRLSILLLPLLTLMLPLMRIVPPVYRWRMRARIVHWYKDMVQIEEQVRAAETEEERAQILARLDEIDDEVSRVRVPVGYRDMHYTLRFHIELLRNVLRRDDPAGDGPTLPTAPFPRRAGEKQAI